MEREKIREKIIAIVVDKLKFTPDSQKVQDDDDIVTDLGADSLDAVEIIMNIEDEFCLEFSDEEAIENRTIKKIVELIETKLGLPPS